MKKVLSIISGIKIIAIVIALFFLNIIAKAQSPCNASTPAFTINLTGVPDSVWASPNVARNNTCCAAVSPDKCIYFNLTLDPGSAGIQIDMIGADPAGSLFYDIGCTGSYPGGSIKCISGVGPHQITFCKPGSNKNIYKISAISKPIFPKDDTTRIGCKKKLHTTGIVNNSVIWSAISGSNTAENNYFNTFLDSLNVASPTYSPGANAPFFVDYQVCGFPIASSCGFSITVCDTVRLYNYPTLTALVTPTNAAFCNINPPLSGITLTANPSGGLAPYSYSWTVSPSTVVTGTNSTYFANANGVYNLLVKDKLSSGTCPNYMTSRSVSQGTVPIVDAGPSQKVCASNPLATINGSVSFASGSTWTGGAGTYSPGNTYAVVNYSPTPGEIAAGFVKLYLTGAGCLNKVDSTIIYYSSTPTVSISNPTLACNNSTATLIGTAVGGTQPYSYLWSTGSTGTLITGGQGNYNLIVTDSLGCVGSKNINIIAPPALSLLFNVTDVTVNGGNNGTASVTVSGGTPAYSVTWTPGGMNTFSIGGLVYGVYTASVKDANGCLIAGSTVVNEPRCLGFNSVTSATNVNCYQGNNGIASVTVSGGTAAYSYTWNTVPVQNTAVATNLNAGVYTVIIKDSNAPACFQTANVTISEPTQLINVMTHTNVTTIIPGNNGAAASNPFGGTPVYTYSWSTSATTSSITNLTPGNYSVTVTDSKGCNLTDYVNISSAECLGLNLNVFKTNVLCYGGNNGSALAVVSGATGSYTVAWSTGGFGPSINSLATGNYSVLVTDSKKCSESFNFSITQPSQLSIGLMPTNVSCNGSGDGTIDLTISGGTYPYTFNWSNGAHSEDLANLSPGTYSVNITDANGCQAIGSAAITQPTQLSVTYSIQNTTCIYATNGAIALFPAGGSTPYTYTWSTGANTQSVSGLAAGGYTVSVKDANGCKIIPSLILPVSQPDSVRVDSFIVSCSVPGSGQTQVSIIPTGGYSGQFQVSYNNGPFQPAGVYTAMLNNNTTYSVVLKDGNTCLSLKPDIIFIKPEVKIDSVKYSKCYSVGTTTTQIVVYPSGGDGGLYQVSFNNGGTYQSPGNYTLNATVGTSYSIVAIDTRTCISSMQVISLPSVLNATTTVTSNYNGTQISCFGSTDGAANVAASGGSGSYTYSWTTVPTQTAAAAINLGAGNYSVTVKDGNNCSITKTVTLIQPTAISATAIATSNYNGSNVSCFGSSDGSASVTASGATAPYTYNWSSVPSQTTTLASGLSAGVYSVVVKDINNCPITKTVTLTQPLGGLSGTTSVTSNYNGQNITCFGASNGSAAVTASNGTSPYSYTWTTVPPQTTSVAINLSAGNYSVTINDANGCTITKTVTINQPSQIAATTSITSNYNGQNISCFGSTDGSALVTASGATAPYTYTWNSIPSQTTTSATNLGAGSYSVIVTDINGCNITKTITLVQPSAITATTAVTSNYNGTQISCFGSADGAANVAANGGTGSYTYSWSTAPTQTAAAAINLTAATYSVIVKDANNCAITKTVTLIQPTAISATAIATSNYNGSNVSCFGSSDGSASVTASGATAPYTYNWSSVPSQTTSLASGLSAGVYSVIVKDANNCPITKTVTLTQPLGSMTATTAVTSNYNGQNVSCFGSTNGSGNVTTSNGTAPYTYSWSTIPVQTNSTVTNLGAGIYTVTIADVNGCSIIKTLTISDPAQITANANVTSNYNGQHISCFGLTNGSASVTAGGGTTPYSYNWNTVPAQTTATANNLGAGNYSVSVTDINGCVISTTVTLTQPPAVNAVVTSTSNYNGYNISCFGLANGIIDISTSGGTGAYTYSWSTSATSQNINNVGAGNYSVIATDANGCKDTLSITLTQPTKLIVTIDSLSHFNGYNVKCNGSINGTIYVSTTGGVTNYSYLWNTGANTEDLTNIGSGFYYLSVTDLNNCIATIDTTVIQPAALTNTYAISQPLCNGVANGSVNLTVAGGVSPITYLWSNNATTQNINNITAGTYTVKYTDANGCKDSITINVSQPQNITFNKEVDKIKCYGDTTANIKVDLNGGTLPYTFNWSNGNNTQNQNSVGSGTYILTITDANGCILKDTTSITQPDSLQVSLYSPTFNGGYNISTYNGNDGSVILTASGGTTPYNYVWSNGATTQNIYNVTAFFPNPFPYSVVVTDSNGCVARAKIELRQPMTLEMPTAYSPNNDGKNDGFIIHGIEAFPNNVLTIFNRWGNIVFEKTGYNNEWDGHSNNGEVLPDGTYFAILDVNKGEVVLKGYVELRR